MTSMSGTPPPETDAVAELLAAGRYDEAADVAVAQGDRGRAIALLQKLWRFAEAVPLAVAQGEQALAVRLALDARDPALARGLADAISNSDAAALLAASQAFAAHGLAEEAATLAERTGDFARAAQLYERGGRLLAAGRSLELAGRLAEAAERYQRVARTAGEASPEGPAAALALGKLLARTGRLVEAARALQRAARHAGTRPAAWPSLIGVLLALGHRDAAEELATRLHRMRPEWPADPQAVAAREATSVDAPPPERFRVEKLLGAGAVGRVYLARDRLFGRTVALKVMGLGLSAAEQQALGRFAREAEAIGRLHHANVIAVYELDVAGGILVMEHAAGGTLADRLASGPLPPPAVRRLGLELCAALGAAHGAGIIHRDVKPANVFFDGAGTAKLGDFGAAHLLDFGQTQTGGFIGTLAYLSPEQVSGDRVSAATDVYALGVTLFQALTGRLPFPGPDFVAQHLSEAPPRASAVAQQHGLAGVTAAHDDVLLRALAKAPADRFANMHELAAVLRTWPAEGALAAAPLPAGTAEVPVAVTSPERHDFELLRVLGPTADGELRLGRDARLGRLVLRWVRGTPWSEDERRRWQQLAAFGGPHVQRVLGAAETGTTIDFEWIEGPPLRASAATPAETASCPEPLAALLGGGPRVRFVRSDAGPVWLVAPSPDETPEV